MNFTNVIVDQVFDQTSLCDFILTLPEIEEKFMAEEGNFLAQQGKQMPKRKIITLSLGPFNDIFAIKRAIAKIKPKQGENKPEFKIDTIHVFEAGAWIETNPANAKKRFDITKAPKAVAYHVEKVVNSFYEKVNKGIEQIEKDEVEARREQEGQHPGFGRSRGVYECKHFPRVFVLISEFTK